MSQGEADTEIKKKKKKTGKCFEIFKNNLRSNSRAGKNDA